MAGLPRWALCLARLAGLAPYRRVSSPEEEYKQSRALEVASVLGLCASGVYAFCSGMYKHAFCDSGVGVVQERTLLLVDSLTLGNHVLLVAALWGRQYRCLRELLNSPVLRDSTPRRPLLAWMVAASYMAGVVHAVVSTVARSGGGVWPFLWAACVLHLSLGKALNATLFAFLLSCVTRRLEGANAHMRRLAQDGVGDTLSAQDTAALRRQHQETREVANRLCYCFGLQVLADLLQDLCWVVRQTFYILGEVDSLRGALDAVVDTGKSVVAKALLIHIAQQLTLEAEKTLSFISTLRNSRRSLNREQKQELEEFSRQIYQQPLLVRLCSAIDLNYRLLFQALGITVSYVTILIQLQGDVHP